MRSRTARLTASAMAWIAIGVAAYFLFTTEKQISERRQNLRVFDLRARELATALGDLRAAQQAYVAAGQGLPFWTAKVAALQSETARGVADLRGSAASPDGRSLLMEAGANITELGNVDRRARDYLQSGQPLMAGDVVFSEGGEIAASSSRQVESARLAEHQASDAAEAGLRRRQAAAIGAAVALGVLVIALLAFVSPGGTRDGAGDLSKDVGEGGAAGELMLREQPRLAEQRWSGQATSPTTPSTVPRGSVPMLKAAAELCTEFGRVNDPRDLPKLLARAADVMDASGVVVWLGNTAGADLRPVLAHGYPDDVLARMPTVPRSANNATATAYRSGKLQIVLRRPGESNGAVAAPLLAPEGCVGALTAEILAGSETTDSVQAFAALIAAQLTAVVSTPAAAAPSESSAGRIAG